MNTDHYDYCPHCHSEQRVQDLQTPTITCTECGYVERIRQTRAAAQIVRDTYLAAREHHSVRVAKSRAAIALERSSGMRTAEAADFVERWWQGRVS